MRACAVFYYCLSPAEASNGSTDEESVGGPNYATVMDSRSPCNDAGIYGVVLQRRKVYLRQSQWGQADYREKEE